METLTDITIYVNEDGTFRAARAGWAVTGEINGYKAQTNVVGDVVAKPITDQIEAIVAEVIAQGPPPPTA